MTRHLAFLAVAMFLFISVPRRAEAADGRQVLHVYTWKEYFSPEAVEQFQEKYDCLVDFTYYEANEAMYETLHTGGGYDLATPSGNAAVALNTDGLLRPLDHSLLPNLKHLDTKSRSMVLDPEIAFSVIYTVTITGIGYDSRRVPPDALGTWSIFSDPRLRGRVSMLNAMREALGAALRELDYDINSTKRDEVVRAGRLLLMWKRNIARFDLDGALLGLADGSLHAIQAYNGDIVRLMRSDPSIGFYVPTTGSAINMDSFVIPKGAENPVLAHAFINHFLDPKIAAQNMEYTCYYQPNKSALDYLPADLLNNSAFILPTDIINTCEVIRYLGSGRDLYDEVWANVLLGDETLF